MRESTLWWFEDIDRRLSALKYFPLEDGELNPRMAAGVGEILGKYLLGLKSELSEYLRLRDSFFYSSLFFELLTYFSQSEIFIGAIESAELRASSPSEVRRALSDIREHIESAIRVIGFLESEYLPLHSDTDSRGEVVNDLRFVARDLDRKLSSMRDRKIQVRLGQKIELRKSARPLEDLVTKTAYNLQRVLVDVGGLTQKRALSSLRDLEPQFRVSYETFIKRFSRANLRLSLRTSFVETYVLILKNIAKEDRSKAVAKFRRSLKDE